MDIVRSSVEDLKGSVQVSSELGHGSTFTIQVPLTLAMIDALLVNLGEGCFALPLESVREIIEVPPTAIHQLENNTQVIALRDKTVCLIDPSLALEALLASRLRKIRFRPWYSNMVMS